MDFVLSEGRYLVAVSGGVDSVVLLELLATSVKSSKSEFTVAHFDHGIRADSADDAKFVGQLAKVYGLEYVTERSNLGASASEEDARSARYEFLRRVCKQHNLDGIVTAHHQDDLIETMFLHIIRGTGRHGLDPMARTGDILRPLLQTPKTEILKYAKTKSLKWHEDSTNLDTTYARNALRQVLAKKLTANTRDKILQLHNSMNKLNSEIDEGLNELDGYLLDDRGAIVRSRFVTVPYIVACEYAKKWLSINGVSDINKALVMRAVIAAKTLEIGKKIDCQNMHWLQSSKTTLEILRK